MAKAEDLRRDCYISQMDTVQLADSLTTIRLVLHVFAAAIWVGGQLVMMGLGPTERKLGGNTERILLRAFSFWAWPALAVLIITGFWNLSTFQGDTISSAWMAVLWIKLAIVVAAGVFQFLCDRARTHRSVDVWGSLSCTCSVLALFGGVLLAG